MTANESPAPVLKAMTIPTSAAAIYAVLYVCVRIATSGTVALDLLLVPAVAIFLVTLLLKRIAAGEPPWLVVGASAVSAVTGIIVALAS
ncbi:hypothetical protein [Rhodococcus qingshengii]|uniref:hypothetical protein n=1 Tax=Rhodococcus qingshengii TaxID=334542 RepID=UPI00279A1D82|nr:hypothetical protein PI247_29215 [Rhodococcus qingshengii]